MDMPGIFEDERRRIAPIAPNPLRDGAPFPARVVADALWWNGTMSPSAPSGRKNWLPPDRQHNCQQTLERDDMKLALFGCGRRKDLLEPSPNHPYIQCDHEDQR